MKAKAQRILKQWKHMHADDPRMIAHMAATHCKPCSCPLCGNPRRHFEKLTIQERRMQNELGITDFQTYSVGE